ncbi:MAG: tetratricopeptide repeat protein [Planctomycetes bacterium]|nr:tetratricopeptide repeat protein [Planctomycetota bacterium]
MSGRVFTIGLLLALAASPRVTNAQAGRPVPPRSSTSPWYYHNSLIPLRPGFSAYYNPYYPLYPSPGLRPMTPLTPAGLYPVPRLFLGSEDARQPEVDWYGRGRTEFFRRDYDEAARDWRRAVEREPKDGNLRAQLALALFQAGDYAEAADAVRRALPLLPQEKWQSVIANRDPFYRDPGDYTDRLRDLEQASRKKPDNSALHLLLGYHYTFLGRDHDALRELDRTLQRSPKDEAARTLRNAIRFKRQG